MKYKIFIIISSVVLFSIVSCNKDATIEIPKNFTKKVLIEEFSGEWCSSCVQGAKRFAKVIEEDPSNYIGVSIHQGDPLEINFPLIAKFLISEFNIEYFPYAIIDRTSDADIGWIAQANNRIEINYNLGLKINTSIKTNELDISISCVSNIEYTNLFLTVYLVEDNVPESSNGAQSGGGGNYIHHHVLRKVLTGKIGEPIELPINTIVEKHYESINIARYKTEDLKVIAFVHFDSSKAFEVMNTNAVLAGKSIDWN